MRLFNKKQKQVPLKRPGQGYTSTRLRSKPRVPLQERHDIIGGLLILFVASLAYSSIAVWFNISAAGIVPKLMLLPQMVVGAGVIVWKFTKK